MKVGYVYVISTDLYKTRNIYKIGFSDNLERRLKQFNNTRTHDDQYYIVNYWKTVKYMTLETCIHHALKEHKLKNELFECPLDKINNTVKNIIDTNSFLTHHDLIIKNADKYNVKWHKKHNYFSMEFEDIEVRMNDQIIITELKSWISVNDKYDLYRFICPAYFDDLISFLKSRYIYDEIDKVVEMTKNMGLVSNPLHARDEILV
jgi:hypothetical protein